jgi:hypothetical protein
VYYNPEVTVLHIKRAASSRNARAQVEFWRAMDHFYRKHYAAQTPWFLHVLILTAIRGRTALERWRWRLAGEAVE